MAGSDSRSRVAVEVFVEEHQIAPVRIDLELLHIPKYWPASLLIPKKNTRHASRKFARHFPQGHHFPRSGRAFDLEVVAKVVMKFLQRLHQQIVYGKPNWSAPVGVPSEQS